MASSQGEGKGGQGGSPGGQGGGTNAAQAGGQNGQSNQNGGGSGSKAGGGGPPAACYGDMKQLCPNAHGHDAMRACMNSNRDQWSDACRQALDQQAAARGEKAVGQGGGSGGKSNGMKAAVEEVLSSCSNEINLLCSDIKPGHGAVMRCLASHSGEVTSGCQSALAAVKSARSSSGEKKAPTGSGQDGPPAGGGE